MRKRENFRWKRKLYEAASEPSGIRWKQAGPLGGTFNERKAALSSFTYQPIGGYPSASILAEFREFGNRATTSTWSYTVIWITFRIKILNRIKASHLETWKFSHASEQMILCRPRDTLP